MTTPYHSRCDQHPLTVAVSLCTAGRLCMTHSTSFAMASKFANMPTSVLNQVFWLTPFKDKLHCEQTCRSWQSILRCSVASDGTFSAMWAPGVWGKTLQLLLVNSSDERKQTKLELTYDTPSIWLVSTETEATSQQDQDCLAWVAQRAAGFSHVSLHKTGSKSPWLFAHTVLALSAASKCLPSLFDVRIQAGQLHCRHKARVLHLAISAKIHGTLSANLPQLCSPHSGAQPNPCLCRYGRASVSELL